MNRFTIKDMENLSGIKAHTLRIWEQRYGLINPKRKDSNHRFYDNTDLKNLLRISHLYHRGLKISKIAKLPEKELIDLTLNNTATKEQPDLLIHQLMESAIDLNERRFEELLNKALAENGVENCMLYIVYPYLEKVGLLWMSDIAIPAQEHFSSCIIQRKLLTAIDGVPMPESDPDDLCLLFTPEGEYHELPLLLIQYLMKKSGRHVIYAGANVPLQDLQYICKYKPVTELYFHLITYLHKDDPDEYIQELVTTFPEMQITISGPSAKLIEKQVKNVKIISSLEEMLEYAKRKH